MKALAHQENQSGPANFIKENIPEILRPLNRFVAWRLIPPTGGGKGRKVPIDPLRGHAINPLDPKNWQSFQAVIESCARGIGQGIGIVLSDQHPIKVEGVSYILTALDFDNCADNEPEIQALWKHLGKPYAEVSPSGKGFHMFGLCTEALKGGNTGDGRELYSTKRFMTMTGVAACGTLIDITEGLVAVEKLWFPNNRKKIDKMGDNSRVPIYMESAQNIQSIENALSHISSDIAYEKWRNIVWSIISTDWTCAAGIAHTWSEKAAHRYNRGSLDYLIQQFDPARDITPRTLLHYARENGWKGVVELAPSEIGHNGATLAPQALPPPYEEMLAALKARGSNLLILPPPPCPAGPATPLLTAPPLPPPPPPVTKTKRRLITADELCDLPATPFVVRGILPAVGLAAIYGEPGSGKSFLALDLAHAISAGRTMWFGFPVRQAPVAYVALEGQAGLAKRIDALKKHLCQPCSDRFRFWPDAFNLLADESVIDLAEEVIAAMGTGAVIIIDTLNQASPGADENASQDMGRIIASGKRLAGLVGGLVVFVHHAGKSRSAGLRGHSSLNAAMDTVIEVTKDQASRSWGLAKAKDDSSDVWRPFELRAYEVGSDAYGPVTSCAVLQTVAAAPAAAKRPPTGRNQIAALGVLQQRLAEPGATIGYDDACHAVAVAMPAKSGKALDRAKEAITGLIRNLHVELDDKGLHLSSHPKSPPTPNP